MKPTRRILLISLIFGLSAWIIDAVLDYFIFYEGTFLDLLILKVPQHELYIRCLILGFFLLFGLQLSRIISRQGKAEEELRKKEYIIQSSSTVIATADLNGKMTYVNPAFLRLWEFEDDGDVLGHPFPEFWVVKERLGEIMDTLQSKGQWSDEIQARRKDGSLFDVQVSAAMVFDRQNTPIALMSTSEDITERKKAEEELENIFNLSPDMVGIFTTEGELLKVNPSWEKVLGYTQKELLDLGWSKLIHPDDVDKTNKEVEKQLKGSSTVNFVNRYKCKNGSFKTLEWQASFSQEGIVHATARDITERKKTEMQLEKSEKKLRELASHLQTVREEERTLVAHELHDEIGQALSALKMDIFMLERKLPKDQKDIADQLKKTNDLLDKTIETTRKIYSELRPTLLEHFSIKEVLEDQLNNFKKSNNLSGDADIDLEGTELEEKDAISLFRIVQEALNNVKWHSQAKNVKIQLKKEKNQFKLIIVDNGIGIKEDDLTKSNSYGIFGMKERANFLGGEIEFKGIPEKGTTITVTIPIKQINLETNRSRD